MFYVIGLGLGDAKDISVKGLEIVKRADKVYLEAYTSILSVGQQALESFYGRELVIADRDFIEQQTDVLFDGANEKEIALLVVGDPFGATTHTDLVLRAKNLGIPYKVIHNASILNAIGCCGLQLYKFGETVSIPYWTQGWEPDSFFEKILSNKSRGLHTLCLLDIQVKEPTLESLTKKVKQYLPPRFMSTSEAAKQILQIIDKKEASAEPNLEKSVICIGVARVGSESQQIQACPLSEMANIDLGPPLHSLVIAGDLHPLETEFLEQFQTIPSS
nr:PREDICTED: diphthine methyl ester synthase [Bemisia tabaci]